MNFTELKDELFARGTNYLEESAAEIARGERWINQAYREVCNLHAWPFLTALASGSNGTVSVPDLRKIISVVDATGTDNPGKWLRKTTYADLVADGITNIVEPGTPMYYWIDSGTVVMSYPLGTDIDVRYLKRIAPLTGTDVPIFDEEYHNVIIDKAMVRAYIDGDNYAAASALKVEINETLAAMAEDYLLDSREPGWIEINDPMDG